MIEKFDPANLPDWYKAQRRREIDLASRILLQVKELSILLEANEARLQAEAEKKK